MDLKSLQKSIMDNKIPHFLILYGVEQKILDLYIDMILQKTNTKKLLYQNISDVFVKLKNRNLTADKRLFIVSGDDDFLTNETAQNNCKKLFENSNDYIILRYNNIKSNSKILKSFDNIVEFAKLNEDVIINYIQKEIDLSDANARDLYNICDGDYSRILLECDKIKQYSQATKSDINKSFTDLINQNVIHKNIGDITFDFIDTVLYGDVEKSAEYLQQANLKSEPVLLIANLLYKGFKDLLLYQGLGGNKNNAVERTGLNYPRIKKLQELTGGYNISELIRNMKICQNVEKSIKTGEILEDIAMDYLILNCIS